MNLNGYRTILLVATLGFSLIAVYPMIGLVMPQRTSDRFSEFWLLDASNKTENYPFVVGESSVYTVSVGVDNHMGTLEYYMIAVKFRNTTQSLPDFNASEPSVLSPLYEYQFFVDSGKSWQSPVTFAFQDVTVEENILSVGYVNVNGVTFPVDASTSWDSERDGFFFQLFFELWRYDVNLDMFTFAGHYVGIWLNMTA